MTAMSAVFGRICKGWVRKSAALARQDCNCTIRDAALEERHKDKL